MMETQTAAPAVELRFHAGTIELRGLGAAGSGDLPPGCEFDVRTGCHRAPGAAYADIVRTLARGGVAFVDHARGYADLANGLVARREPRPYQTEALAAWRAADGRGVVVLPTGAGKTFVAHMAIDDRRRATLVVAPTLDLVRQWHDGLSAAFGMRIGLVGGGDYEIQPITVTTYDSAYLHMEHLGNLFGLLVFDECHHLPGPSYALAARLAIAPFRLGLSATPERDDGGTTALPELIGPIVYRKDIVELSGDYLAPYETVRVLVDLAPNERQAYAEARGIYRDFVRSHGIRMDRPGGWTDFLIRASRGEDGRRALDAYRQQRAIAFTAPAKLDYVERLLHQHRHDRTIIFTQDNATVHLVSRRFLVPAITHRTGVRERSAILADFATGRFGVVVTSRVLNEGVDVPDANVAIVMSGSGSVREHVQRLGRVLRKRADKRAILYELVTGDTGEAYTSQRRRDHIAYR